MVFDTKWFEKHNTILTLLARTYLGSLIFQYRKMGHYLDRKKIVGLRPNSVIEFIRWKDGKPELKLHTFSTNVYAKNLRKNLYPLWYVFHVWDLIVDPFLPSLSFGFSTLTVNPDAGTGATTVDGPLQASVAEEAWSSLIAEAGNVAYPTVTSNVYTYMGAGTTSNKWTDLLRAILTFDTSPLTSSATITAAVLSIYGTSKNDDATAVTPDLDVYTSTPAANNNLTGTDFSQIGSTSQTGSPITYTNWSTTGYNDFTFNATGISNVSKTGVSKFGTRNANYDVAASAPTWTSGTTHSVSGYYADNGSNMPKLVITYTLPGTTTINPTLLLMGVG